MVVVVVEEEERRAKMAGWLVVEKPVNPEWETIGTHAWLMIRTLYHSYSSTAY